MLTATVWDVAHATCCTGIPLSSSTGVGTSRGSLQPCPSCPLSFPPHVKRTPSSDKVSGPANEREGFSKHTSHSCRAHVSTGNEHHSLCVKSLYLSRACLRLFAAMAKASLCSLTPSIHSSIVHQSSSVKVTAGHLQHFLAGKTVHQQRCEAVPWVAVSKGSRATIVSSSGHMYCTHAEYHTCLHPMCRALLQHSRLRCERVRKQWP